MTALKTEKHQNIIEHNLFKEYNWFYKNLYLTLKKLLSDFFENEYQLRLISITYDENILFYGDEYFVNKIPVNNNLDIKIKISSKLISSFLDNALGEKEERFKYFKTYYGFYDNVIIYLETNLTAKLQEIAINSQTQR